MLNVYDILYDLINSYIFGNSVVIGSYQDLICIIVSVLGCLFLIALPFIMIFSVIRFICGR